MDSDLAASLDIAGLRRALPALTGDPRLIAVAEVLRLGVVASTVGYVALGEKVGSAGFDEGALHRAFGHHVRDLFTAPTDAGWWVHHCPQTSAEVSALVSGTVPRSTKGDRANLARQRAAAPASEEAAALRAGLRS